MGVGGAKTVFETFRGRRAKVLSWRIVSIDP